VTDRTSKIQALANEGTRRLLARAAETYSLGVDDVMPRALASLEKYLLRDSSDAPEKSIEEFCDQLQADDLCLSIACERGNETAWQDLVERYSTTVRSAARSAAGSEDAAEDLAQSIWAELHGLRSREDGRPASKLAYYSGRGSFAGWLRAVVAQLAVDQHRKQSRLVQAEDDSELDRLAANEPDGFQQALSTASSATPEHTLTNKLQTAEMERALARAFHEMDAEDKLLVKLYYFDNLRLREAGAVLGVHEATASRRLARVHLELRRKVEEILAHDEGWTATEIEAAFAEVGSSLESDVEALLASRTGKAENLGAD
jgi:RNA polymerase sigma-70 factor (ECF subfamily)